MELKLLKMGLCPTARPQADDPHRRGHITQAWANEGWSIGTETADGKKKKKK